MYKYIYIFLFLTGNVRRKCALRQSKPTSVHYLRKRILNELCKKAKSFPSTLSCRRAMVGRSKRRLTVPEDRVRFVTLWMCGISARDIAENTGASVTTVYRWVRRWQDEGTLETRWSVRRPGGQPMSQDEAWMFAVDEANKSRYLHYLMKPLVQRRLESWIPQYPWPSAEPSCRKATGPY